jgi:hypothetical protein
MFRLTRSWSNSRRIRKRLLIRETRAVRCILNLPEPRRLLDLPPEIKSWLSSHVLIARGVAHALFELSGRNPRRFPFLQ